VTFRAWVAVAVWFAAILAVGVTCTAWGLTGHPAHPDVVTALGAFCTAGTAAWGWFVILPPFRRKGDGR
jgi:hypothetical protein